MVYLDSLGLGSLATQLGIPLWLFAIILIPFYSFIVYQRQLIFELIKLPLYTQNEVVASFVHK